MEVQKQARIVDDPVISEYINRLGQNLARNSDVTFPVSFRVIEADEINAFTLPGGYIFLNTGVIRLSDNEAELASVLAHELGLPPPATLRARPRGMKWLVLRGCRSRCSEAGPASSATK